MLERRGRWHRIFSVIMLWSEKDWQSREGENCLKWGMVEKRKEVVV